MAEVTIERGRLRSLLTPRRVGAIAVVALLVFGVVTFRLFVRPKQGAPSPETDAFFVLGGGDGERYEHAISLARDFPEAAFVLSTGNELWPAWSKIADLCDSTVDGVSVQCVRAFPDSTKGEAATFSALARERGWDNIVVVTSANHLHRSVLRFEQCHEGTVVGSGADVPFDWRRVRHEWLGTIEAVVLDRDCG